MYTARGSIYCAAPLRGDYLPEGILQREKAAFSDAVGHSLVDDLKSLAERTYGEDWEDRAEAYAYHAKPFTKESLLYREIFEKHYPRPGGNDCGLLDAQPGVGGLQCG